jgi:hypothetical protein
MFDALFAFVGPVGSAIALFAVVLPFFLLAAVDTIRLARPEIRSRWAALAGGLGSMRLSRTCIASALSTDDSPSGDALRLRARALARRLVARASRGSRSADTTSPDT